MDALGHSRFSHDHETCNKRFGTEQAAAQYTDALNHWDAEDDDEEDDEDEDEASDDDEEDDEDEDEASDDDDDDYECDSCDRTFTL